MCLSGFAVLTVFVSLCVCLCLCVVCVASNPPRCGAPGVCLFDWVCVSIWESVCLDCLYISVCLYIYVFTCVCLCACTYCKQSTTMPPVCVCDAVPHWCPKRPIGNLCRQWPRRSHAPLLADATPPLSCVAFCPFVLVSEILHGSRGAFFAWRAPILSWPRIMSSQVRMLKFLEPSREMP